MFSDLYESSAFIFVILCLILVSIIGTICLGVFYIAIGILRILIIIKDFIKGILRIGLGVFLNITNKRNT